MVSVGRSGFTLIEAIVSLVISSALVGLVSTVFLVQTDFYGRQVQRTVAQDNARSVTELVATELRTTMKGGLLVANDTQLVVRSPIKLAAVCALQSVFTHVFYEGGQTELDTAEMSGVALYDSATSSWSYGATDYASLDQPGENPEQKCGAVAADTSGGEGHFNTLKRLKQVTGLDPVVGGLVMFYRETEFVLTESTFQPGTVGLYRGTYGETLVEFASGMDPTAQFLYRTGGTAYTPSVSAYALFTVDAVRFVAATRVRAQSGGGNDVTAGWSVNVPLRNVN